MTSRRPTWSEDDLRLAVASSTSWRGTLRALGLRSTSSAAIRCVREHADRWEIDHAHFTSQRRWSSEALTQAVAHSATWTEVTDRLGLTGGSASTTVRGHARRMGLDTSHLDRVPSTTADVPWAGLSPHARHLRRAGPALAAAWFIECGADVSWPLEPCAYDLLVMCDDRPLRVQVKTTTVQSGGAWAIRLTRTRGSESPYDPDEIDAFFLIDPDGGYYLVPVDVVAGRFLIHLSAYAGYRLTRRAAPAADAPPTPAPPHPR